jgi:sugar phosphate isomerase/epimerase
LRSSTRAFVPACGRRAFVLGALGAVTSAACSRFAPARSPERVDHPGLQLYTLRDAMARDLPGTLARVRSVGFVDVEVAGLPAVPLADVRRALDGAGLTASAARALPSRLRDQPHETIAKAAALGAKWIVCEGLGDDASGGESAALRAIDWLNRAAEAARDAGLRLAFRNDDELPEPLFRTDPALVAMEMNAAKLADPVAWIDRHPGRFALLDLQYAEGGADLRPLLARRDDAGVEHLYVGDDDAQYPFGSIEAAYRYLTSLPA